jgi:hypothetical protein
VTFSLHLKPDSLVAGSDGNITGVIYVALDELTFPDSNWDDYPVVIVSWWLSEAGRMAARDVSRGRFRFMDGPYWFEAFVVGEESWLIRLIDGRNSAVSVAESRSTKGEMLRSLAKTAETLIAACRGHGWKSVDVDELCRQHALLSAHLGPMA